MINKIKNKLSKDIHLKELLKGSSIAFIFKIVGIILGYLFVLFITKNYGSESLGIFILSLTILQISSIIARMGMDTMFLRFCGEYNQNKNGKYILKNLYNNILLFTIPSALILTVLLYFTSPYISIYFFNKESLILPFQIISLAILPYTLFFIHKEAIRGLKKMLVFSFFNSTSIVFFGIIFLPILFYFSNLNTIPIYAQFFAILTSSIIAFIYWKHYLNNLKQTNTIQPYSFISKKNIFSISLPMMLASSLFMIMNWTDILMLGVYVSEAEVGLYSVALKVALLTSIILIAVNSISAPKFAELWAKHDIKSFEKLAQQSSKIIFFFSLPIVIIITTFSELFLSFFGTDFGEAKWALIILVFGQFINSISGSVGNILQMTGHEKIYQNIIIISVLINILLNYLLIPIYGILGAAIATSFSTISWNLLSIFTIKKKLNIWVIKV